MTDDEFWSATDQLTCIHQWARARYAAPWAVFFAVLLRVAASVGPHVRLPGEIGGQASLNLLCAFVSPSGGGKGISDKVGRLAWPAPILELPIGSGEGIAETFTLRGKESEDNERIIAAIFNCSEIDILTGLESRQGSTILGTLKAFAMGEQLGSTNASKANSRNVPAHSYRGCLSVGAQPGHTGVIFNDVTGGTPQRFLWALTVDPDMPADRISDPKPLNHNLPGLLTRRHDDLTIVEEIVYGPDEIRETIIAAHLARQRGEGDALDGHWMLTRLKVAGVLALTHHRTVVSELDWQLSEIVMAKSDETRAWMIEHAKQAVRAKVRERAIARATGEDFYDASRLETVKRSIMRMLERDGEQPGGDLRRRLGKREKRELFDQAIALLEGAELVSSTPGEHNSVRYRIGSPVTHKVTPQNARSEGVTSEVTRDHPATVTDLDSRRSQDSERPTVSCPSWLASYIEQLRQDGNTTTTSFAVHAVGRAEGHSAASISNAISANTDMAPTARAGGNTTYSITGEPADYKVLSEWVHDYLDALPANTETVDKDHYRKAAADQGHNPPAADKAMRNCGRVRSITEPGYDSRKTIWKILVAEDREDDAS